MNTDYENDWYLPTTIELIKLYKSRYAVNNIYEAITDTSFTGSNDNFWPMDYISASTDYGCVDCVQFHQGSNQSGRIITTWTRTTGNNDHGICAIRQF